MLPMCIGQAGFRHLPDPPPPRAADAGVPSRSAACSEPTPKILSILAQEREKVTATQFSFLIGDTHKTEFNLPVANAHKIGFVFQFCLSAENQDMVNFMGMDLLLRFI